MEANYFNLREFGVEELELKLGDNLLFYGDNFFARLKLNDLTAGQTTFTRPPQTLEQQINIDRDELVTKEYCDALQSNGGKFFYLNFSQTDPVYTLYKILSPTVDFTSQQFIQTASLGTNLLVQFLTPEIDVTRLQAGLFTLNQFGTRTGSQGTVQFYFQIYLFSNNTLVGTSGLSNNISTSIDLFSMVFNLTSNIEVSITERLVLKLYSVGTLSNGNVRAYFEGGEYSFLTTTLSRASDLLGTDNVWTGENVFDNPPNDPKEVATTDTIVFSMTNTSNTWINTNNFLTKSSPNGTSAVATTAYCDNLVLINFSSNNTWGTHLFTNETNSSTQLATCKYVVSKAYLPNINNTFSGINTFLTPTANSQQPASTKYVKDKFSTGFLSNNNAFTGTGITFTKSNPADTANIATTKYMRSRFLNFMEWGTNIQCQTVTTSGITLANTSATRTITNARKASLLLGNNTLDNVELTTQASTDNSTRIATNEYVQNSTFASLLSSINNWTLDQNFPTQDSTSSNTRMASTAFVEAKTFSMIGYNITGIHTVVTPTIQTGTQIANLDYTIANKPNFINFLGTSNTWTGTVTFPTAITGTSTREVATTAFVKGVFNTDLLNANTWSGINLLPAIVGTTNNTTRGATTACIPNYFLAFMPFFTSSFPTSIPIDFTGTCLTPSPSGLFIDTRVANTAYVNASITTSFENAGNDGIIFTVNQLCPTRTTPSTLLANTAFVASKIEEYFSTTARNSFKASPHTWSANNFFNYALSTLDNSTLGATCSYVTQNFSQSKNYLGAITFESQPEVARTTYPSPVQEIGYTRTFVGIKTPVSTGFNTLIDFGNIEIGNYIFSVKETVTCTATTSGLNVFNFFWGPSVAVAEQIFSQFTGSGAWNFTPNILNYAQRLNVGVTTYHRVFPVSFVNASSLVHSVRLTGTLTPIFAIRCDCTITKIG